MKPETTPLDAWIRQKITSPIPLSPEALVTYQIDRINQTLNLALAKSRFYQRRLEQSPGRIVSLGDLARLPFTTAEDLRENGLQMLCVSQDEIHRVVTLDTTGTTGQPKRIYFTNEDQELTVDFFHAGMSTLTGRGERVLILLPCERPGSVGDLLATGLERLGAHPIRHGIMRDVRETLEVMRNERVDGFVGIPLQALWLARHSQGMHLKNVLLSTDYVSDAVLRALESAWGCTVYNHYGMTEMGLGGGVECQARRGYHLREADMFFEIVDLATGEPAAEGETGEVVFTTLTRRGMPLIRYRTGDLSRFVPGTCPCGTSLRTLERIRTRASGFIPIGAVGKLTIADLDEALLALRGVVDYEAAVIHNAGRDALNLTVYLVEGVQGDLTGVIDTALETIPAIRAARLQGRLDVGIQAQYDRPVLTRPIKRTILVTDHSGILRD
jgi:phenylacetate-coenzyme A ligase PaaK-like adenylate-forming protein